MPLPESVTIPTDAGPLAGLLHLPANLPTPAVICCHGMLSSKDSRKLAQIAEQLSMAGAAAVRFDFSGCGESRATLKDDLLSSRMRDLNAVLDYVKLQPWSDGTVGLFGSSLGGYLSLLAASAGRHSVQAVVCWATPFNLGKIRSATGNAALSESFPPQFCLGSPESLEHLSPIRGGLIIHGQQDEIVEWQDGIEIYRRVAEPKRLLLVGAAEHRFIDPLCRKLALEASLEWFRETGVLRFKSDP